MNTIFDTLQYSKRAQSIGIPAIQAEFQAEELSKLVNEQLVTKSFLSTELKSLEITMIKWMIGIALGQIGLILTILSFVLKTKTGN